MATWTEAWGPSGGSYNAFQLRMVLERVAVDVPGNRSLIRSSVWLFAGSGWFSGSSSYHYQSIAGVQVLSATVARSVSAGSSALVMQNEIWVGHDNSGGLSVYSAASFSNGSIPNGISVGATLHVDRIDQIPAAPVAAPALSASGLQVTATTATIPTNGGTLLEIEYAWRIDGGAWTYIPTSNIGSPAISFTATGGTVDVCTRGRTARSWGPYSALASRTLGTAPAQISAIAYAPDYRRLTATWAPPTDGGLPILRYEVQVQAGGTWGAVTNIGTARSYTITTGVPGMAYRVRARAVNAAGTAPWRGGAEVVLPGCSCAT